jgi:hypothetical protein
MATISSIIKYVPTIGENDQKDEKEQFAVMLKAVKIDKKQSQLRKFIEMDPKKLMKEMMDARQQGEIVELLNQHFVRFVNFRVAAEATQEEVAAGKEGLVNGEMVRLTGSTNSQTGEWEGVTYERPAVIKDIFELGEYELAMEIFMHMIGSSQLRKTLPPSGKALPETTTTEEREDEEKNSGSPSGTTSETRTH